MNPGDRIEILKQFEIRSGDKPDGKLRARYREGGIYACTPDNLARMEAAVADGSARLYTPTAAPKTDAQARASVSETPPPAPAANKLGTTPGRVRGRFTTRKG